MRSLLIGLVVNMLALAITAYVLPGIHVPSNLLTLAVIALVFGVVNAIVKPILTLLSLPFIVVTLGLFLLILNGFMLVVTDFLTPLDIDNFWWAVLGAVILSIVGSLLNLFVSEPETA